jgi:DNA-binding IclR family transcriptional regulator
MQQLEEDIAKVRKEGVAFSFAEHINLLAAASAPIRKYGGEIIASLGITWVTDNPDPVSVNKYLGLVKEAADNISREMGYMNLSKEV